MGKALYRKYRPTCLADVVGQDQVVTPLQETIKKGNFSHAYLFTGPRGCGKTSVARIFAHEVNGFKYELEDNYVDIIEIDAASNTGVDDIRELRDKAIIAPTEAKYKIYIIDEVHMLSKSAFNALLKILEEPPEHVIFLMATTNPEKIPVTVLSRAQNYVFKLASCDTMQCHLEKIAKSEKIKISSEAVKIIVERGGGSFRDSISLLDQISNISSGEITADDVHAALGLPADQQIRDLLAKYDAGDINSAVDILRDLLNTGIDGETLATDIVENIMSTPTPATLDLVSRIFKVQAPFADAKLLVAFLGVGEPVIPAAKITSVSKPAPAPVASIKPAENPAPEPITDPTPEPTVELTQEETALEPEPSEPEPTEEATEPLPTDIATKPISTEAYLEEVLAEIPALSRALKDAYVIVADITVDIYPAKLFDQKVLQSEGHFEILKAHSRNRAVVIHDHKEQHPRKPMQVTEEKAEEIKSVSDIMGGVEEEQNADDPF